MCRLGHSQETGLGSASGRAGLSWLRQFRKSGCVDGCEPGGVEEATSGVIQWVPGATHWSGRVGLGLCCSLFGLEVKAEVVGRRVILDSRGWDRRSGTQGTVPATMWESQDE